MTVVYDAGALIAAERSDRTMWADHRIRLDLGLVPVTTSPVVAQVSRSGRQAQLRRFLRGCEVVPFDPDDGHAVGELVGRAGVPDVVDAHAVITAHRLRCGILTSDEGDLRPIAEVLEPRVPVFTV